MEFQRRFGKRKRPNPKRGIVLVVLLIVALLFWFYAKSLMEKLFG